jgi:anti-anti-sigma factor
VTTEAFGRHESYVRLTGEFDLAQTASLGDAIEGEIRRGHRHLVIDLSAATLVDCASIGTVLRAVMPLRRDPDATVVLAGPTGVVKRLFDLIQLERLFDIVPDVGEATRRAVAADHPPVDGWRRGVRTMLTDRSGADRRTATASGSSAPGTGGASGRTRAQRSRMQAASSPR